MVVITGIGRCGTSFLAKFIKKIGYEIEGGWDNRMNAGLEDPEVTWINDRLSYALKPKGKVTDEELKNYKQDITKDPRFTHRGVAQRWYRARKDMSYLVCYRKVEDTYKSFERVGAGTYKTKIYYHRDFSEFIYFCEKKKIKYDILLFPDFLKDFDKVKKALGRHGIKVKEEHENVFNSLVDMGKVHFEG